MKRLHLFELEDQEWFPSLFRGFITDLLQYQLTAFDVYTVIVPKIKEVMQKSNCSAVIDLCSGSSGPLIQIQEILENRENYPITVTLTDKYPNIEVFTRIKEHSDNKVGFIPSSVDATSVQAELEGLRTLFSCFHHFKKDTAKKILQDAASKNMPIGVFEFTERTVANLIKVVLFGPLLVWLNTPFIRPFKWSRFFWTYIIPVAPLVYSWDALVSHLRTYSPKELNELISEVKVEDYSWEIGQIKSRKSGFNITYLVGYFNSLDKDG